MLWNSLEAPHRGASNEYPQHVFMEKKEKYYVDTPSYLDLWMVKKNVVFIREKGERVVDTTLWG